MVLLHGLTGNGACWTSLARTLEAEFDVVMPDARGHGKSSTPQTGYLYKDYAHDVVGLIQALELVNPILLGHSMGGMTTALVASQMGVALRGVVLADLTFLTPERQREVYKSDVVAQHRQFLSLGRETVLTQARRRHAHRHPEIVKLVTEARLKTSPVAFDVLIPPNPDYRQLVRAIDAPILLVIAERGVLSLEIAHDLQTLNPRLRIEQIQDAGRALQYDQAERFAEVVNRFLQSLMLS